MILKSCTILWMLASGVLVDVSSMQDASAVIDSNEKAWRRLSSLRARVERGTTTGTPDGTATISVGVIEIVVTEGRVMWREEVDCFESASIIGGSRSFTHHRTEVDDGVDHFLYIHDSDAAIRWKGAGGRDPRILLRSLEAEYSLAVMPDETVANEVRKAIKAVGKRDIVSCAGELRLFFREDGIGVREECYGGDGKLEWYVNLSNLELGVELAGSRFVLEVPDGVEIKELPRGKGAPIRMKRGRKHPS